MLFCTWRGVSLIHAGLLRFWRKLPLNVLPPLRVITLTTPPENRPYDAGTPPVSTDTSCTASSMNRLFCVPKMLSLVSTPFTMNRLS